MDTSVSQSMREAQREDVLTLDQAAAYLQTKPAAVEQLVAEAAIPAQRVSGEWRFLKRALDHWLRFPGQHPRDDRRAHPAWLLESPFADELLHLLEERLLHKLRDTPAKPAPGSKHAVLAHFGALRDEGDLDEQLEAVRKRREAGG